MAVNYFKCLLFLIVAVIKIQVPTLGFSAYPWNMSQKVVMYISVNILRKYLWKTNVHEND